MMNGQKVVKVFNHEVKAIEKFNALNDNLCEVSNKANAFSNMLMPINKIILFIIFNFK